MDNTIQGEINNAQAVRNFNEIRRMPEGFYERSNGLTVPERLRDTDPKVIITGTVDGDMFRQISQDLSNVEKKSGLIEGLDVTLSSYGGETHYGFGIHDLLVTFGRKHQAPIRIEGYGPIMSAGALIIQAGDIRCMPRNSTMLLHPSRTGRSGTPEQVKAGAEQDMFLENLYRNVISERVQRAGNLDMTPDRVRELMNANSNGGTYLTAEQALDLKLIDEVI